MPTRMEFEVQGMAELANRMNQSNTLVKITLNEGLRNIGRLFVPHKGGGPLAAEPPKRTGKLRRSTIFQIVGGTTDQRLEIRQGARSKGGAFYGFFVREGTQPHEIVSRRAKALRFIIAGKVIFARRVHHPGTRPNPYHKRVMARLQDRVQQVVNQMGSKVTAYLSGR